MKVGDDFYAKDVRGRKRHWYILEIGSHEGNRIFCACLYFLRKRKYPALAIIPKSQAPGIMWFLESEVLTP